MLDVNISELFTWETQSFSPSLLIPSSILVALVALLRSKKDPVKLDDFPR